MTAHTLPDRITEPNVIAALADLGLDYQSKTVAKVEIHPLVVVITLEHDDGERTVHEFHYTSYSPKAAL